MILVLLFEIVLKDLKVKWKQFDRFILRTRVPKKVDIGMKVSSTIFLFQCDKSTSVNNGDAFRLLNRASVRLHSPLNFMTVAKSTYSKMLTNSSSLIPIRQIGLLEGASSGTSISVSIIIGSSNRDGTYAASCICSAAFCSAKASKFGSDQTATLARLFLVPISRILLTALDNVGS